MAWSIVQMVTGMHKDASCEEYMHEASELNKRPLTINEFARATRHTVDSIERTIAYGIKPAYGIKV